MHANLKVIFHFSDGCVVCFKKKNPKMITTYLFCACPWEMWSLSFFLQHLVFIRNTIPTVLNNNTTTRTPIAMPTAISIFSVEPWQNLRYYPSREQLNPYWAQSSLLGNQSTQRQNHFWIANEMALTTLSRLILITINHLSISMSVNLSNTAKETKPTLRWTCWFAETTPKINSY